MRLDKYLCMAGVEVSNGYRVASYVTNVTVPGATMDPGCACAQLDDGFDTPSTDPAPWYEPTRPESADFLGFSMEESTLQPVSSRSVSQNGRRSSSLGPLTMKGRIVQVQGLMLARSAEGMAYGERWLTEVLRGSPCGDGGCSSDELVLLPACPESPSYDGNRYFRHLVNVGLVDGPVFTPVVSKECVVQQASFVLTSTQPWLYHPGTHCLNQEPLAGTLSCALTTPSWMGHATFRIEVENVDTTATTGITIQGQISLDGTCPVSGLGTSVPPSWSYEIPTLAPEDKLVIDGRTQDVLLYDASEKYWSAGLSSVDFSGPFVWPDVGPCTTMCVTITGTGGDAVVSLSGYQREL